MSTQDGQTLQTHEPIIEIARREIAALASDAAANAEALKEATLRLADRVADELVADPAGRWDDVVALAEITRREGHALVTLLVELVGIGAIGKAIDRLDEAFLREPFVPYVIKRLRAAARRDYDLDCEAFLFILQSIPGPIVVPPLLRTMANRGEKEEAWAYLVGGLEAGLLCDDADIHRKIADFLAPIVEQKLGPSFHRWYAEQEYQLLGSVDASRLRTVVDRQKALAQQQGDDWRRQAIEDFCASMEDCPLTAERVREGIREPEEWIAGNANSFIDSYTKEPEPRAQGMTGGKLSAADLREPIDEGPEYSTAMPLPKMEGFKPKPRDEWGKVNRNDPCPCGSGKKYKKCCGR